MRKDIIFITKRNHDIFLKLSPRELMPAPAFVAYRAYKDQFIIQVAKELPQKARDLLTVHELGHIYYKSVDIDVKEELEIISKMVEDRTEYKFNPQSIKEFLNICTDLEINSTILDKKDNEYLKKQGLEGVVPSDFDAPDGLTYRGYYPYVIDKLNNPNNVSDGCIGCNNEDDEGQGSGSGSFKDSEGNDISSDGVKCFNSEEEEKEDSEKSKGKSDKSDDGDDSDNNSNNQNNSNREKEVQIGKKADNELPNDNGRKTDTNIGKLPGNVHSVSKSKLGKGLIDKYIAKFILDNLELKPMRRGYLDSMRLYNRKSRGNGNLMHNSIKVKVMHIPYHINIVIDVSGSMDYEVVSQSVRTILSIKEHLSKDSTIILWDTSLCKELKIHEMKLEDAYYSGGGTDMARAVKYCSDKKYSHIIMITDLGTNLSNLERELEKINRSNCIVYDSERSEREWLTKGAFTGSLLIL